MREKYIHRFNSWLMETKHPGIYRLKKGGHLVRIRTTDPFSRKEKEVRKVLPRATIEQAMAWQAEEKERLRLRLGQGEAQRVCFDLFAASILQRKIDQGKIKGDSIRKTTDQYAHLINGTTVIDKATFELLSLAVSAINGCEMCVKSHDQAVKHAGLTDDHVHEAVRIAAVVHAAAVSRELTTAAVASGAQP